MAKRRKRRRRASKSNPKRRRLRRSHRRRRARRANPHRAHRKRRVRRAHRRNPRRRRARVVHHRRRHARSNPRRRHFRRRRARRNPSLPGWAQAGLAVMLGLAGYVVVNAGSAAISQRIDPSLSSMARDRYIAAAVVGVGGVALAFVNPLFGVALLAASVIAVGGAKLSMLAGGVLDKKPALGAVFDAGGRQQMGGYNQIAGYLPVGMQAVYGQDMAAVYGQDMAAVYGQDMAGMGAINGGRGGFMPKPPWARGGPF